MVAVE
jgi:hypothetical protein